MGYFNRAMTVSVGFDGLHEINPIADQSSDFLQVAAKVVQVHFHPAAVFLLVF